MTSARPRFSIIVTCYNYEAYVGVAIESALAQTYQDFEIIVVDDGSTDDSWGAISKYRDRVKAIRTANRGSVSACLTGFQASSGSYIIFLDADDALLPQTLSVVAQATDRSTSKIQFMLQPIDGDGCEIATPFPGYTEGSTQVDLVTEIVQRGCYATPPTTGNVYRRDVYENIGRIDYDWGIDGVAYLLAPFLGNVVTLPTTLGLYRMHGNNMTSLSKISPERLRRERDVFFLRLEHLNRILENLGISKKDFLVKTNYFYTAERDVYSEILANRKPGPGSRRLYLKGIREEMCGLKRLVYLAYAMALIALPVSIAKRVIKYRLNPERRPAIRSALRAAT